MQWDGVRDEERNVMEDGADVPERDSTRNRFVPRQQGRSQSKGRHPHCTNLGKSLKEEGWILPGEKVRRRLA